MVMSFFSSLRSLWTVRDKRIVTCPETHQPVGLNVNHRFVVTTCTRWPEREGCDQACTAEVRDSPEETLVRTIVTRWYSERLCIYCDQPIEAISGSAVVPALRSPDGVLREWRDVSPEDLPALLETSAAVCARCELAESFRRDFPQLVTDRAETPLRKRS
jgi:hypothetical protein